MKLDVLEKLFTAIWHLDLFNFNPWILIFSNTFLKVSLWECTSFLQTIISSWEFPAFFIPQRMLEIVPWETSEALCNSYGILLKWCRPNGVLNVSNFELSASTGICQYPQLASNLVKTFPLDNLNKISSVVETWWW